MLHRWLKYDHDSLSSVAQIVDLEVHYTSSAIFIRWDHKTKHCGGPIIVAVHAAACFDRGVVHVQ